MTSSAPRLIVIMGVSGTGKSTLAHNLALRFGYHYLDADDLHTDTCKDRMKAGIPLDDASREMWVDRICSVLDELAEKSTNCVLAYSGLRQHQRQRVLASSFRTLSCMLTGELELLENRLGRRVTHFMPASLVASQLATLELPGPEEKIQLLDCSSPLNTLTTVVEDMLSALE